LDLSVFSSNGYDDSYPRNMNGLPAYLNAMDITDAIIAICY
jgi:hypothetical protein